MHTLPVCEDMGVHGVYNPQASTLSETHAVVKYVTDSIDPANSAETTERHADVNCCPAQHADPTLRPSAEAGTEDGVFNPLALAS